MCSYVFRLLYSRKNTRPVSIDYGPNWVDRSIGPLAAKDIPFANIYAVQQDTQSFL